MSIRDEISELDPEALYMDGFDDAIIGIATRCGQPLLVVYSYDKCIEVLAKDMTEQEAEEYMSFNVEGAWVGERTPIIVHHWVVSDGTP